MEYLVDWTTPEELLRICSMRPLQAVLSHSFLVNDCFMLSGFSFSRVSGTEIFNICCRIFGAPSLKAWQTFSYTLVSSISTHPCFSESPFPHSFNRWRNLPPRERTVLIIFLAIEGLSTLRHAKYSTWYSSTKFLNHAFPGKTQEPRPLIWKRRKDFTHGLWFKHGEYSMIEASVPRA